MDFQRSFRQLLAFALTALLFVILAVILFVTESALNVWERLQEASPWVVSLYLAAIGAGVLVTGAIVWRLLWPSRTKRALTVAKPAGPKSEQEVAVRLEKAVSTGLNVEHAQQEWAQWHSRRAAGHVYVAFFGEISSGKSSLIQALLPEAHVQIDVRGGTTRQVEHYVWRSPAGDELRLADVPGTNEAGGGLDQMARDEALRAHVVVYVCDGDLTRRQNTELQQLLALDKPTLLAFNKSDRYSSAEIDQIVARLRERVRASPRTEVVNVRAGGVEQILRRYPDGREETLERPRAPDVEPLRHALQRRIDQDPKVIEQLRDAAVFVLVQQKLDDAEAAFRRQRAADIVRDYTRKAIVGALAAVSPGTDILVQGYLGANMVKELCALYETPARSVEIERLLEQVQGHTGRTLPVVLALAGNTLKAFPGIGTVAGGVAHAVAYGLIFDAMGRAIVTTLASRGELHAAPAASLFKETMSEGLESRARRLVEVALDAQRESSAKERATGSR